ncbi:peptidylprolyl isomerase [Sandaracinobacter neustonicus]|uniref:Peptidyl-prolyl cis-trans isomerase n=1 Tax=Sandaracinobacter neustonicus TaxID=1715348 RepID=A0A501XUI7_9SPHN|nr:peptidylprolyl isomerase [Sandaracinobacter neustonicus]TPE63757.1 peptidylprolyl isomerase [Sandaracinobacter neustonicus]
MIRLFLAAAALAFASPALAQLPQESAPKADSGVAPATIVATSQPPLLDPENILYLDLSTGGRVAILLRPQAAPNHVERIKTLVRRGFYDGIVFHRVIDGFMAQTGDPKGTGEGGSDLPDLKAEFNDLPHVRGAVSMARTQDPNSANSQFFIMFQPLLRLDRTYTVFGRVFSGMQWVDAIERGEPPANPSRILQASIAADNKAPPAFPAPKAGADPVAEEAAKLMQQAQPANNQPPKNQPPKK